jgi:hypothetical protein
MTNPIQYDHLRMILEPNSTKLFRGKHGICKAYKRRFDANDQFKRAIAISDSISSRLCRANDFVCFPQLYLNDIVYDATRQQLIQKKCDRWNYRLGGFQLSNGNVIPRRNRCRWLSTADIMIEAEKGTNQFQNQMDFVASRAAATICCRVMEMI